MQEERRLQEWQQAAMTQSLQMHQTTDLDSNSDLGTHYLPFTQNITHGGKNRSLLSSHSAT